MFLLNFCETKIGVRLFKAGLCLFEQTTAYCKQAVTHCKLAHTYFEENVSLFLKCCFKQAPICFKAYVRLFETKQAPFCFELGTRLS